MLLLLSWIPSRLGLDGAGDAEGFMTLVWEFLFNPASLAWSCTPQSSHAEMNQSCLVCLSNQHSWGQIKILCEADGAVQS